MLRSFVVAVLAVAAVGCGSSGKYTCRINGSCFQCPSGDAVSACIQKGPSEAGCTAAASSVCD